MTSVWFPLIDNAPSDVAADVPAAPLAAPAAASPAERWVGRCRWKKLRATSCTNTLIARRVSHLHLRFVVDVAVVVVDGALPWWVLHI